MAVTQITLDNFKPEVLDSDLPVLVDFWASWCNPCRMLAPIVEELAGEVQSKVKVAKLNIDEQGDLAVTYGVMSIPTLVLFDHGKEKNRIVGLRSKDELLDFLEKNA